MRKILCASLCLFSLDLWADASQCHQQAEEAAAQAEAMRSDATGFPPRVDKAILLSHIPTRGTAEYSVTLAGNSGQDVKYVVQVDDNCVPTGEPMRLESQSGCFPF